MEPVWKVLLLCGIHCYTCCTYMHVKEFFSCKIDIWIRLMMHFFSEPCCVSFKTIIRNFKGWENHIYQINSACKEST